MSQKLQIGDWIFDTGRQSLAGEGCSHPLSPKEAAVLLHLIRAAPDVVLRDELMGHVWPRVVVGDHVLHEVVSRLRRKLGDHASSPRYIETLAKRGYRMMHVARDLAETPASPTTCRAARSVAVVPFQSIDDEPAQQSHAIGLTEELRTLLAGYPELETIEISSASLMTSSAATPAYVVKGSVQRVNDGMRVRAQLVRKDQSCTVWSTGFSDSVTNPDMAEAASSIGRRVRLQIVRDQQCQMVQSRARSPEAASLACAAIDMNYQINQQGHFEPSLLRMNAERAVELDNALLEAYQLLPTAYYFQSVYGELAPQDASRLAHRAVDRALAIEPDDAFTVWARSFIRALLDCDYDSAERDAHRAIARDPLHPNARWFHGTLAQIERRRGNLASALDHYRRAVDVYDSDGRMQAEYAETLFFAGEYREAVDAAMSARQLKPYALSAFTTARSEVQSLLHVGEPDKAEEVVRWYLNVADFRWKPYVIALYPTAPEDAIKAVAEHPNPMTYPSILSYLAGGATELAIVDIRRGIEALDPMLLLRIRVDPAFDALRDNGQWPEMLHELRDLEVKTAERRSQTN